jgi:transglutaminase-like putative cysteine protease
MVDNSLRRAHCPGMYQLGADPRVVKATLPPGRRGTAETLRTMRSLAQAGARDVTVREAAVKIVRAAGVVGHDFTGELRALFEYVRDSIRFTRDTSGVELLQGARYTLEHGFGDCDDKATLLAALLGSIGNRAGLAFRAIATGGPGFSHVYPVVLVGGRTLALDATYTDTALGSEYPNPSQIMDMPVWPT